MVIFIQFIIKMEDAIGYILEYKLDENEPIRELFDEYNIRIENKEFDKLIDRRYILCEFIGSHYEEVVNDVIKEKIIELNQQIQDYFKKLI